MKITGYVPQIDIEGEFDSIEGFKQVHPDTIITHVNDSVVIGICENCGGFIFEDEKYLVDKYSVCWHYRCDK